MNGQTSPSFCQEINFHDIQRLLILLGIGMQYMGFKLCSQAIFLAIQEPDRLLATSKWLYPDVAKRCGVNCQCVERNIRTVIAVAWKTNPQLLSELAGYSLSCRPKATQFIAILVFYFLQRKPASVTS